MTIRPTASYFARAAPVAGLLLQIFATTVCNAQDYPTKPGRIVVGYTTGGANDIIARLVAQKFTESWSQQFIVDNRPGAIGIIGSELVARAAPDGYTLGVVSLSPLVFSRFTCAKLGIVAPARTPRAIVEKLHGALLKIATQTDIRERFAALGLEPMTMPSPEAFAAFLKDEIARWSKVAQYAGIKAQ